MKWARKRGAINDERKLEPSAVNSARKERGGGGGGEGTYVRAPTAVRAKMASSA